MDFLEMAKNRYSERFFDPRPVEQEKLNRNGDDDDGGIVVAIVANDASIKKQEVACNYFPSF